MPTVYLSDSDMRQANVDLWAQGHLERLNAQYAAQPKIEPPEPTPPADVSPPSDFAAPSAIAAPAPALAMVSNGNPVRRTGG